MISKYESLIINKLLDKYEKSKSFIGTNKVNQKFSVKISSIFPQYNNHSNFELFQSVNESIDILARKRIIFATVNSAKVCSDVTLNETEIAEAYKHIGRVQKRDINNSVIQLLNQYKEKNEILNRFCEAQIERIILNQGVQFFNNDLVELENILIAVDELLKVNAETFFRDFSVRVFKDSKLFERLRLKIENLMFEYGDFPEKDQVLATLNIVKNPTYINFKGAGILKISGQVIDLNNLKGDIAISSSILPDIEEIKITGKSVTTIENLTSFHSTDCGDRFLIYLGGFHNSVRREFIKKIHLQNPSTLFYHFGDIDAGGFYILEHLKRLTGVDFQAYKMDLDTLKEYKDYCKRLTDNDRDRLKKMREGIYEDVIDFMLANDCKLEQEAIKENRSTIATTS